MLPEGKKTSVINSVRYYKSKPVCEISKLAKLIGTSTFACPLVKYWWLYTKTLERDKCLALSRNNKNYSDILTLSKKSLLDLTWWEANIPRSYNDIKQNNFAKVIFTDSC